MGILHRLFNRHAPEVWQAESRLLHRFGFVQPPQAVQWISTSVCDLHCPHCYSNAGRKTTGELTTDEAKSLLVDELVKLDRPTLVIAGGEALLRKDFGDIVAYTQRQQVTWALHSHGGKVEHLFDVFQQYPPVMAAISLDGTREVHDEFRGKEGCFDSALAAIRALKMAGCPEVVASTTITSRNADLLADMLPIVMDSGVDSWGFHLMTPEGRASQHPELLATGKQLRRAAGFARRVRAYFSVELDNEWGSAGRDDCFYRDDRFACGAGRISCVVAANGEVMACTTTDPAESQGNVRVKPLSRIWADGFGAFRSGADALRGDCNDCWLNTRHGRSCRKPAFYSDLFDDEAEASLPERMIPLTLLSKGGQP